jgi:hypothetical protein
MIHLDNAKVELIECLTGRSFKHLTKVAHSKRKLCRDIHVKPSLLHLENPANGPTLTRNGYQNRLETVR